MQEIDIKKPFKLSWISSETWSTLKLNEKDYVILHFLGTYSKEQIMRRLHIAHRCSYWRLQKAVQEKIKEDVAKLNKTMTKTLNS